MKAALAIALMIAASGAALAQGRSMPPQMTTLSSNSQSSDRVMSPSVWGSWMSHRDPAGNSVLDVLVLWRGTPGWWQATSSGRSGGSGGARGSQVRQTIRRGGLDLVVTFDTATRIATVQDKSVPLQDANVVFVDDVDGSNGLKIVRTLKIDPALPAPTRIDVAVQRSPDVISYLRCDVKLPDAKFQAMLDIVCAQMSGK